MTETEGRRWFRKKTRGLVSVGELMFQPIESSRTGIGVPDWWFRTRHDEGWVEEKELRAPLKEVVRIPWRPGQFEWMRRYVQLGGHGLLFVFVEWCYTNHDFRTLTVFEDFAVQREYSTEEWRGLRSMDVKLADVHKQDLLDLLDRRFAPERSDHE
jgi:hypothetical protein